MVASVKGRCAGCQKTGPIREIERHTTGCEFFAQLYAADPFKALSPGAEFIRYQEEDRNEEALEFARQQAMDEKKSRYQDQAERKLDQARERWGLRGGPPLRSAPARPIVPGRVPGAVLSSQRAGLPGAVAAVVERAAEIYGGSQDGKAES